MADLSDTIEHICKQSGRRVKVGLDTNVLGRSLVQGDPDQSSADTALIDGLDESRPALVSVNVVAELHRVLRRAHRASLDQVATVIRTLLDTVEIQVQENNAVLRALDRSVPETDFTDGLIAQLQHAG